MGLERFGVRKVLHDSNEMGVKFPYFCQFHSGFQQADCKSFRPVHITGSVIGLHVERRKGDILLYLCYTHRIYEHTSQDEPRRGEAKRMT